MCQNKIIIKKLYYIHSFAKLLLYNILLMLLNNKENILNRFFFFLKNFSKGMGDHQDSQEN